jgi:hypothetical protein
MHPRDTKAPFDSGLPSRAGRLSAGEIAGALLLFLAAVLLRVWRLNHESLWLDEFTTWVDARKPLSSLLQTYHALSFLLLRGSLLLFGDSNAALRLPGVLCGLGAVLAVWWTLRREFGRGPAFLGLALAALSPYQVHYSRDANHYGPTLLLSALTLLLLQAFLRRPRILLLVILALLQWAAFRLHPFNLALAGSCAVVLIAWALAERDAWIPAVTARLRQWPAGVRWGLLIVAVGGLLFIAAHVALRLLRILSSASSLESVMTVGYAVTPRVYGRIAADLGAAFFDYRAGAVIAGTAVFLLAFAGVMWSLRLRRPWLALFGALVILVPHVVLATIPFRHFFTTRYLAFQSPTVLAFAAVGLWAVAEAAARNRFALRVAIPALAIGLWLLNVLPSDLRLITRDRQPYEAGAEAIARNAGPDDKVFCYPPWSELPLRVTLERRGQPVPRLFVSRQMVDNSFPTLFRLAYLAWLDDKPLYYYASYRKYDRVYWPTAWNWFSRYFETILEQPSGYVEDYARKVYGVGVYRFQYPGQMVLPLAETTLKAKWGDDMATTRSLQVEPLLLGRGEWALEIRAGDTSLDPVGWRLRIDGQPTPARIEQATDTLPARLLVSIATDKPRFQLTLPTHGNAPLPAIGDFSVRFGPPRNIPLRLMGGMAVDFGPFRYVRSRSEDSQQILELFEGAWAEYLFQVPDHAPRHLVIVASARQKDMPLAVELDGRPLGLVSYPENQPARRVIPLQLSPGEHRLRVFAGREPLLAARNEPPPGIGRILIAQVAAELGEAPDDNRTETASPGTPPRPIPRDGPRPW